MEFHFASVLAFVLVACVFLFVTLLIGKIIRPSTQNADKGRVYECGETPLGAGWFNFNPRFYVVGLIFLIFDIEVVFTYPVAAVFRRWLAMGQGAVAFLEIATFVVVLAVGLAYVWAKGDLDWVRTLKEEPAAAPGEAAPVAAREG